MSSMEEDASRFLKKIVKTLSASLLWMIVNTVMGIYFGWMFFADSPGPGNYIFYAWMLISLGALLYYFNRIWKKEMK